MVSEMLKGPLRDVFDHRQLITDVSGSGNNWSVSSTLKPIFHQNAKSFALGTFASPNAKDSTFALHNAINTNMLVSFALGDANFLRWPCTFLFFVVYFICIG